MNGRVANNKKTRAKEANLKESYLLADPAKISQPIAKTKLVKGYCLHWGLRTAFFWLLPLVTPTANWGISLDKPSCHVPLQGGGDN